MGLRGDPLHGLSVTMGKRGVNGLASASSVATSDPAAEVAARSSVALTPTAWRNVTELDLREWLEHGRRLGVIGRAVGWWIGDWLRYGSHRFGERYARAARITGYDTQTLMNMAYVASRYDPSERRTTLSWTHHAEVAGLDGEERERLLDLAESERLSARCLREEFRRTRKLLRAAEKPAPSGGPLVCPECGHRLPAPVLAIEGRHGWQK